MVARGWKVVLAVAFCLLVAGLLLKNVTAPAAAVAERHPHIHAALDELRAARDELKAADTDFKGHKAEAIEAIDGAIKQLKICLDND